MKLTILNLYPDLLHTNGCSGNVLALKKRLKWRGIDIKEFIFTTSAKSFPSEPIDFIIIGDGFPRETAAAIAHLTQFASQIKDHIESGGVTFASGSGFEILGAIDALDIMATPAESRLIGDIFVQTDLFEEVVIGFENHAVEIDIGKYKALGTVVCGKGNNGNDGRDGLVYNNTICTNAAGPTLAKNPKLCDYLIQASLEKAKSHRINISGRLTTLKTCPKKCVLRSKHGEEHEKLPLLILDDTVEREARQFALKFLKETAATNQAKCIEM